MDINGGEVYRRRRRVLKIGREALAEHSGLSVDTIRKIEGDVRRRYSPRTVQALAAGLTEAGCPTAVLEIELKANQSTKQPA